MSEVIDPLADLGLSNPVSTRDLDLQAPEPNSETEPPGLTGEVVPARSPEEWAEIVRADLAGTVPFYVNAGRHLAQAKEQVEHGEWLAWIARELPFGEDSVERLIVIGSSSVLSNSASTRNLPPTREALYVLAKMPEAELREAIEAEIVHPRMTVEQARELAGRPPRKSPARAPGGPGQVKLLESPASPAISAPSEDMQAPEIGSPEPAQPDGESEARLSPAAREVRAELHSIESAFKVIVRVLPKVGEAERKELHRDVEFMLGALGGFGITVPLSMVDRIFETHPPLS